jgi:hypothetical protein
MNRNTLRPRKRRPQPGFVDGIGKEHAEIQLEPIVMNKKKKVKPADVAALRKRVRERAMAMGMAK